MSGDQASVASATRYNHNLTPGSTLLHNLAQTVVETFDSRPLKQYTFEDIKSKIPYQLPFRGNSDSLLTAIKVASCIEAPKPQGRNDSVVFNLGAQAVAPERSRETLLPWIKPFHTMKKMAALTIALWLLPVG